MQGIILDFILLSVLVLFAALGARRGLILSLCSLAAVILALLGGSFVTDLFTPTLAKQAAPMLESFLNDNLELILAGAVPGEGGFLWSVLRDLLEQVDLSASSAQVVSRLALLCAQAVIRPVLFLIAFVLILILWFFLSHALDLVARLPVLHTLNAAGGLVFGAVKGALILAVAALLIQFFFPDLIPPEAVEQSFLLDAIQKAPPLF